MFFTPSHLHQGVVFIGGPHSLVTCISSHSPAERNGSGWIWALYCVSRHSFQKNLLCHPGGWCRWVGLSISEESSPSETSPEVEVSSPVTEFLVGKHLWNEGRCKLETVPAVGSFLWDPQDAWLGCVTDGPWPLAV